MSVMKYSEPRPRCRSTLEIIGTEDEQKEMGGAGGLFLVEVEEDVL